MKRRIEYQKGSRWAAIDIELNDGKLSICGEYGDIRTIKAAKYDALMYWHDFFEECPAELTEMNKRCNTHFNSSVAAAKYVLQVDGDFHGLDVVKLTDKHVYTMEGCGQCLDSIMEEFPDFPNIQKIHKIWKQYHLNDMKAGTEEQEQFLEMMSPQYDSKKFPSYYDWACQVLRENNLLEVPTGRFVFTDAQVKVPETYKYGSGWLKRELPPDFEYILNSL